MKKSSKVELTWDQTQKVISLALEERNPYEAVKKEFGLDEKTIVDIMKSKLTADKLQKYAGVYVFEAVSITSTVVVKDAALWLSAAGQGV